MCLPRFLSTLQLHSSIKFSSRLLLLGVFVLIAACHPRRPVPSPHPVHGYVHAKIYSDLAAAVALPSTSIAVPDIDVTAKNMSTGAISAVAHTDPYGYFHTAELAPGEYQICVSGTNFDSSCDPQVINVSTATVVMDHIVTITAKRHAVVGSVRLADKTTPCFWYNPTFDANYVLTAQVTLTDSSGNVVAGPIRGNSIGEYVMPTTAAAGNYSVNVACEAAKSTTAVALTVASLKHDIVLNNNAPTTNLLEAFKASTGVRRASPGDALTVKVPSVDVDHDTLHYKWVDESGNTASFPDAASVNWIAPSTGSLHVLQVQVSDGHGGYAVKRTVIPVGPDEMLFNGIAFNRSTHAPVGAASVTLNGVATITDADGKFQVKVPDTTRFVLNVIKPGYALTSRIFYARATNIKVPLDPAQTGTVDGNGGGKVNIPVTGCKPNDGGKGDSKSAIAESRSNECPRQEIGTLTLTFEPHSLVAGGSPFTGTATVEGFQFDLTLPNAIPGDQSATYKGKDARLQTFGAIHVLPRDSVGNPLQMASGKSVTVSMPIHPLALATAPAKIPFFRYEESTGTWVEHGELTRVGNNYVGKITHFSEFNADTTFGSSSCMKIQLDQGPHGFPSSVILNASYVNSAVGNFNHPNTPITDTQNPIVIERLVPNEDFHLEIRDGNTNAVLQNVLLNSGPPVAVAFPVPYPYDGCKPAVVFNNSSVPPSGDHFLIFGTVPDNSSAYKTATTTGNYANRDTLPHWLSANGFGGGATETHAVYFNNGDLKFGRNMHCRNVSHSGSAFTQDWIACYVSNFGSVGIDFGDQAFNPLSDATNGAYADTHPVATVTMEYHPDQVGAEVQFWAYKGNGDYFPNPALDVEGAKPLPDICTGCHQGSFDSGSNLVKYGAKFLPFDVDSFIGDDGNALQTTIGSGAPRPTQDDFRQLNQFAMRASGTPGVPSTAVQKLMKAWYGNANVSATTITSGATFTFGPNAAALGTFTSHTALYDDIVRPVCRTCHIAFDSDDPNNGYTWDNQNQMVNGSRPSLISSYVCGPGNNPPAHDMPHAQVPYKRFWSTGLNTTLGSELSLTCSP